MFWRVMFLLLLAAVIYMAPKGTGTGTYLLLGLWAFVVVFLVRGKRYDDR